MMANLHNSHSECLSPRVRGNHPLTPIPRLDLGSIPACAGETEGVEMVPFRQGGLSPRVRGNPSTHEAGIRHKRSIPACAGKPICM